MVVSIAVTAWLVWMQGRALKKGGSLAVEGDRAHYAADLLANVVVLIGVGSGAFLDAPGLDAAAGLVVAVWLFWGALTLLRTAADHLLDHAVPEEERAAIIAAVVADERIAGVHQLRTRMAGPVMMIQMHVDLEPTLSLESAHALLVEAENRVLSRFPAADILIHPDPRGRAAPHGGVFAEVQPETESDAGPVVTTRGPWS
jgi:cation diffusion facilitator family transporter